MSRDKTIYQSIVDEYDSWSVVCDGVSFTITASETTQRENGRQVNRFFIYRLYEGERKRLNKVGHLPLSRDEIEKLLLSSKS